MLDRHFQVSDSLEYLIHLACVEPRFPIRYPSFYDEAFRIERVDAYMTPETSFAPVSALFSSSIFACDFFIVLIFTAGLICTADNITLDISSSGFFLFACSIFEDVVHLLESLATCFRYKIERPNQGQKTENGKKRISPKASVLNERWRDQSLGKDVSTSSHGQHPSTHNDEVV